MAERIAALTIWQPWAALIVAGCKPFEFRRWPAPGRLVGQRIALHAGARPVKRSEVQDLIARLRFDGGVGTALRVEPALDLLERVLLSPGILPLSSVIAIATLGRPRRALNLFRGQVADSNRIDQHMWAWPLTDIRPCEPPVPARGAQGFWSWSAPETQP